MELFQRFGLLMITVFMAVCISVDAQTTAQTTLAPTTQNPTPTIHHDGTTVTHPATPSPALASKCPAPTEISSCQCFDSLHYIICTEPIQEFNLKKSYQLKSLIIRNTNNLPSIPDTFTKEHKLHVDSLVIMQDETSAPKLVTMENLEALFGLTANSIKIISTVPNSVPLDVTELPNTMESITLTGLTLQNFDFSKLSSKLKHLTIQQVTFEEPIDDAIFLQSELLSLEIENVTNFTGSIIFQQPDCTGKHRINIRVRNNPTFKNFELSGLFPKHNPEKCHYHLDLSGNEHMNADFLTLQAAALTAAPQENLYLIMRDVPGLNCNCAVKKAQNAHPGFFHGISCKADGTGTKIALLEKLALADFKDCN